MLPIGPGNAIPTNIQEFDGFDTIQLDTNRWNTKVENGSTLINLVAGKLIFSNDGTGTAGISYIETIAKYGKIWRISIDMGITIITGLRGESYICLYKDSNNYIKIGPYKDSTINCNCLLRFKMTGSTEHIVELTGDDIDTTYSSTYTIAVINDTILFYYKGYFITSMPFKDMVNYSVIIATGTASDTDTITANVDNYESINQVDTILLTMGKQIRDIRSLMGTSLTTDISGNVTLTNTTEQFISLTQATYGTKFKVNLFADLEGANIDYCLLDDGGSFTNQSSIANTLTANSILLVPSSGSVANDAIYFGNLVIFKRLDVYMEQGTSNTNNVFVWEGWTGAAWVTLTATDGTNNGKVFGKSGKVTFTDTLVETSVNGITAFWIRARVTTAASALPKATHVQVTEDGTTGFDSQATFLSDLVVRVYRKRGDGSWATLPADLALPFTQCILYRNIEISNLPAWTDIAIGFKLSATPVTSITIPYTGYVETVEV